MTLVFKLIQHCAQLINTNLQPRYPSMCKRSSLCRPISTVRTAWICMVPWALLCSVATDWYSNTNQPSEKHAMYGEENRHKHSPLCSAWASQHGPTPPTSKNTAVCIPEIFYLDNTLLWQCSVLFWKKGQKHNQSQGLPDEKVNQSLKIHQGSGKKTTSSTCSQLLYHWHPSHMWDCVEKEQLQQGSKGTARNALLK